MCESFWSNRYFDVLMLCGKTGLELITTGWKWKMSSRLENGRSDIDLGIEKSLAAQGCQRKRGL